MNDEITKRVKEVLKEKKIKQVELSKAIRASASFVSDVMNGRRYFNETYLDLFCEKYHINLEWVLHGTGEKENLSEIGGPSDLIMTYNKIRYRIPKSVEKLTQKWFKKAETFTDAEWQALDMLATKILEDND